MTTTTRTNDGARCPVCDKQLDAATNAEDIDAAPKAGDISVCIYCHTLLEFNEDLTLRLCSQAVFNSLSKPTQNMLLSIGACLVGPSS